MKLRNLFIALFCILIFALPGGLLFKKWSHSKPFGVILIIADGFSPNELVATRVYKGGAESNLFMEELPNLALCKSRAADSAFGDLASSASALATGFPQRLGNLSADDLGGGLITLFSDAQLNNRATGFVSDSSITSIPLAAFYAHSKPAPEATLQETSGALLVEVPRVAVALSVGKEWLLPDSKGGLRKDGRDLISEIKQRGSEVIDTKKELFDTASLRVANLFGVFPSPAGNSETGQPPTLGEMVKKAIECLQYSQSGYFLVVHCGAGNAAVKARDGDRALESYAALDDAVRVACEYGGSKATVIVAGLPPSSGLGVSGPMLPGEKGLAVFAKSATGTSRLVWLGGTNANAPLPTSSEATAETSSENIQQIGNDTVLFAKGKGTEKLSGVLTFPQIHEVIAQQL